jgi:hypothetical protein
VSPPVFQAPKARNLFMMYIAVQERVIGAVPLQEEDGKEFSVAYVSQRLLDVETRYVFMKKLCLSLYYACSKFRHYILSSSCIVACQYDVIKHILLKPMLSGRIGKWAYALVEYNLAYEPLRSMKGQVVADFIVDHAIDVDHLVDFVQLKLWGLYFDGSVCCIADFIVDHAIDVDHSVDFVQLKPWGLYFDGSVCSKGQGFY